MKKSNKRKAATARKTTKPAIQTENYGKNGEEAYCEKEGEEKKASIFMKTLSPVQLFLVVLTFVYSVAEYVFNWGYRQQCENYYNIPAKYFYKSIDSAVFFVALFILLLCIPSLFRWLKAKIGTGEPEGRIFDELLLLIYSFAFACINLLSLNKIYTRSKGIIRKWLNFLFSEHIFWVIVIVMAMAIFSIAGWGILHRLRKVKHKVWRQVFCVVLSISVAINVFILVVGAKCVLDPNPEWNTEFEIAEYMGTQYAVISEYNGEVLVVPMIKDDEGKVSLDTSTYRFLVPNECEFYYYDFGYAPPIINSKKD